MCRAVFFCLVTIFLTQAWVGSSAIAQAPLNPIRENKVTNMPDATYAFVIHAQPRYQSSESIIGGAEALLTCARRHQIRSLAVVNSVMERNYVFALNGTRLDPRFSWLDNVDRYVESWGGQHRLNFPNARNFILGGGMLSWCFCEFLRDTIRGVPQTPNRPLRLILVTDAIYDPYEFGAENMQQFIERNGNAAINKVLLDKVLGQGAQEMCFRQNMYAFPNLYSRDFSFRFFRGSEQIGGNEQRPGPRSAIDIVMVPSSELASLFPYSPALSPGEAEGPRVAPAR